MKELVAWSICAVSALALSACNQPNQPAAHEPVNTTVASSAPAIAQPSAGPVAPVSTPVEADSGSATNQAQGTNPNEKEYSADYRACMSSGDAADGVTAAMADCNDAELAKQDGRLNRSYKAAMAARASDEKARLLQAQRAWIKLRDSKCQEDATGGTMDILIEGGCRLSMTIERAVELERMIG